MDPSGAGVPVPLVRVHVAAVSDLQLNRPSVVLAVHSGVAAVAGTGALADAVVRAPGRAAAV
jgi:hypothetical protein